MGNSKDGSGYGCSLPAMINSWRQVWTGSPAEKESRLFGIATLAAGGSEGAGQHMAGMRWSQTANYGFWPNPAMPNVFGAQVYDLGDTWANANDGNAYVLNQSTGEKTDFLRRLQVLFCATLVGCVIVWRISPLSNPGLSVAQVFHSNLSASIAAFRPTRP